MAAGIGPDDGVITTTYSFFATAGCIARLGAQPIFVDIDPNSYNISPESLDQVLAKTPAETRQKLKAIIPVHLYGQCAQMKPIRELARKYDLCIIEDAAQAIGAEYEGNRAGSMGDCGCFSFFPTKNLGAFGDGGAVTTSSDGFNEKLRILRAHGSKPKYYHHMVGGNFRLDALQAAVVLIKLKHLDQWTCDRQENACKYRDFFHKAGMDDIVELPLETGGRHIFNQFVISVKEKRDELRRYLNASGIGTEIYYPVPLHLQACFANLNYKPGDFPNAEHAAEHTLALPIYPELTDAQQEYVVAKIKQFYQN
jgi:dTDP-4-amino-4,6-dideoxygalactose transaminase